MLSVRDAARALNGDVVGRDSILCPGPGHRPSDRSLSVRICGGRFVTHSHSGDDWRLCRRHVESALGMAAWSPDRTHEPQPAPPSEDALNTDRSDAARRAWERASPIGRHPPAAVARYFLNRRLALPPASLANTFRWAPPSGHGSEPAGTAARIMNALRLIADVPDAERAGRIPRLVAVERTFVDGAGRKLTRRALGPTKGAACMIDPIGSDAMQLVIAEGVFTAYAASRARFAPVWSVGGTGGFRNLYPFGCVDRLLILADHDSSGTGERAAVDLAQRWRADGREVEVWRSPVVGEDAADLYARCVRADD